MGAKEPSVDGMGHDANVETVTPQVKYTLVMLGADRDSCAAVILQLN